jgi:hypothetical protein
MTTEFDPVAVGDKIRSHLEKADKAKASQLEHATAAGVLLLDVKENHPEDLENMCQRIGLQRSRRFELLAIASGKRTQEETKAKTKARVDKHREKKKAKALPPPESKSHPLQPAVTDDDPEASAERRKAEYAAMEAAAEAQPVDAPEPAPVVEPVALPRPNTNPSGRALTEFKVAADQWLSKTSKKDSMEAINYAMAIFNRLWGRMAA